MKKDWEMKAEMAGRPRYRRMSWAYRRPTAKQQRKMGKGACQIRRKTGYEKKDSAHEVCRYTEDGKEL